jgi:hypothetical protein
MRAKHYAELSGETVAAIHGKRKAGHYIDGIHTKIAEDGNLWVNVEAIEKWVEQGRKSSLEA